MFRDKKLRRAAAQHIGCEPDDLEVLQVQPSRNFNWGDDVTTTWVLTEDSEGHIRELPMEGLFGLPTPYVVPGDRHFEVSGDYETFKMQEELGMGGTRRIANKTPIGLLGSVEDREEQEAVRRRIADRIRRNAKRMMEEEQRNQREGDRRLQDVLTARQSPQAA